MSRLLIAACLSSLVFASSASADQTVEPVRFAKAPAADITAMPARYLDRDAVRAKLAANRAANLARFRAYQKKGVFPSNTYSDDKLNVWRDAFGNLCAAATIINSSNPGLVTKIADSDNFIRLGDVKQGPVLDWILTSGLTQDEIAAIQEPFMGVGDEPMGEPPVLAVDPAKRKAEDARLLAKYKQVDAQIVKHAKSSLDKATDRLMKNPALAFAMLDA
jgi:hypothetical protein